MVAFSKVGNIRGGPTFVGITTSGVNGSFTMALPAGLFSKPPAVIATGFNVITYLTSKTATSVSGIALSVPALVGVSGAEIDIIATASS